MPKPSALWALSHLMFCGWTLTILFSSSTGSAAGGPINRAGRDPGVTVVNRLHAPPQAAKSPRWKSREECRAFDAIGKEYSKTASSHAEKISFLEQTVSLAEAFLQEFLTSDFKVGAYVYEIRAYSLRGKMNQAVEAARNAQNIDPDNFEVLTFLSAAFPEVYRTGDPDAILKLNRAESDAVHGLDVLQRVQKPADVTDAEFNFCVNGSRAFFNGTIGFVDLQRKDYANAIIALTAASANDPTDGEEFYRLGRVYIYSAQPDFDYGIWFVARAEALARVSPHVSDDHLQEYLRRLYVSYHGNEEGLEDIVAHAFKAVIPPDGFNVAWIDTHKIIYPPATSPYGLDQACPVGPLGTPR